MNRAISILCALLICGCLGAGAEEPLACDVQALSAPQRERHRLLGEKLRQAVVRREKLANGYALSLDLGRLPRDAAGSSFCVVEVAEWVDLESRCCPFLDFGIDLTSRGGSVTLRLTGGRNAREFIEKDLAPVSAENGR